MGNLELRIVLWLVHLCAFCKGCRSNCQETCYLIHKPFTPRLKTCKSKQAQHAENTSLYPVTLSLAAISECPVRHRESAKCQLRHLLRKDINPPFTSCSTFFAVSTAVSFIPAISTTISSCFTSTSSPTSPFLLLKNASGSGTPYSTLCRIVPDCSCRTKVR